MHLLFELGHQPHISTAEVLAVFESLGLSLEDYQVQSGYLFVETGPDVHLEEIMSKLGGSLAAFSKIERSESIEDTIVSTLLANDTNKKVFCIRGKERKLGIAIKKRIKAKGHPARYIEYKNTATILHNKLVEDQGYFMIKNGEVYLCHGIQPLEEFTHKDEDKPGFDRYSGMLPPKLARMMINLSAIKPQAQLLDPFCGSGVLLMEALDLGYDVIGSDISDRAVEDSRKNVQWIKGEKPETKRLLSEVLSCDAQKLANEVEPESIDLIVSEPYMGKPLRGGEEKDFLKRQAGELGKLYVHAFTQFHKILKPGGTAIFIIPKFHVRGGWTIIDIAKDIMQIGFVQEMFTPEDETLVYQRKGQHVAREIFKFTKQ